MAALNLVIALAIVAVSWWFTVRLLRQSMSRCDASGSARRTRLPDNRIRSQFRLPSGPVNSTPVTGTRGWKDFA